MDEISQRISEKLAELEPQVTSPDRNERKLARRLRIERRLEALRRQNEPEQVREEEKKKEKSFTQMQIEKSIDVLKKLLSEGEERVSNIKAACDTRETDRREADSMNREKLIELLEEEAQDAENTFNEMSEKWFSLLKLNDPLHINDKMMQQRENCRELLKQKDDIITMLREELDTVEQKFRTDQGKQLDEISLLSNRIEKQVALTRKAYRDQLKLIQESMQAERKVMMDFTAKKWNELYKKRDQEEQINSEKKNEQLEDFDKEMTELRRDFQEKYRETKMRLEKDIDKLELELQGIKALAMLNSEKLDYNYQILKKREDENIIIKSQQKRRINKLQDVVNTLKRRISEYTEDAKIKIGKVSAEIAKLQKNILDIEAKADHFAEINDVKFNQLWEMNVERMIEVVKRILTIDRILHEQLLGKEWAEKGVLRRKELKRENLPSYKRALQVLAAEARARKPEKRITMMKSHYVNPRLDKKRKAVRANLLKHIMTQIADKAGFILESRLHNVLQPYGLTEKTLIRMDNVFSALNITKTEDIDELLEYFLPYSHCPVCYGGAIEQVWIHMGSEVEVHQVSSTDSKASTSTIAEGISSFSRFSEETRRHAQEKERPGHPLIPLPHLPVSTITNIMNLVIDREEDDSDSDENEPVRRVETLHPLENMPPLKPGALGGEFDSSSQTMDMDEKLSCQYQHPLVISSVYVLKALRHFVSNYYTLKTGLPTMEQRLDKERNTMCRLVNEDDIKSYWAHFRNIFTKENEALWNTLSDGLRQYHDILKDRKFLYEEVKDLRKQNTHLKKLLRKYMQNRVHHKLDAPCAVQRDTSLASKSRKR